MKIAMVTARLKEFQQTKLYETRVTSAAGFEK